MKEGSSTIVGSQRCRRRGVSSAGTKGASRAKNGYRTVRRLRKTAVAGRNGLAKPLPGKKIAENRTTHHEHEPKWEIPVCYSPKIDMQRIAIVGYGFMG